MKGRRGWRERERESVYRVMERRVEEGRDWKRSDKLGKGMG